MPRTAAIVPAAGRGERLGAGIPKALMPLAGVPMLVRAVQALAAADVDLVVIAAPPDDPDGVRTLLAAHPVPAQVTVVPGGATRQESVRRALAAVEPDVDVVLVHDAARPLVPVQVVNRVIAAVRHGADAVVPGVPVADTIKAVTSDGTVRETVDRSMLIAVQTPQGFRRDLLERAHAVATDDLATDDAGLVERLGGTVVVVAGAEEAFKVTRPLDVLVAEAVLATRERA